MAAQYSVLLFIITACRPASTRGEQVGKIPNSKFKSMPSKSVIFKYFLVFFIGGIFSGSLLNFSSLAIWLILICSISYLAIDFRSRKNIFLFFCSLGFVLGVMGINSETEKIYEREPRQYEGIVKVVEESQVKKDYSQLVVMDEVTKNKYLVNTSLYPRYQYGDRLDVRCVLVNPENQYPKFDYIKYLAKNDIYQICKNAKMERLKAANGLDAKHSGWKLYFEKINTCYYSNIYSVKTSLEEKINQIFPSPESEYLAGLLLGGSDRLPADVAENFRRTGTTHTVAVSGYNITILAEALMILAIAVGFWRTNAFWLAVIGIIFFVMMIGSPASAVRAAIMGMLLLWASKMGRLSNSIVAILLAGAIMIAFSPLVLLYDVGFQLSFLATLGIVLIYGPLSEHFEIKKDFMELKSIFLVTMAAQLGVLGVLFYTFETFSPVSLMANLLILPLVPYIMFGGFFVSILGYLSVPLAKLISVPIWLALKMEIKIIAYLASFSWSLVDIKGLNWMFIVIYYLFFILLVVKLKKNINLKPLNMQTIHLKNPNRNQSAEESNICNS